MKTMITATEALRDVEKYITVLEENSIRLTYALTTVLSQYKLFVGPDDEIAKATIALAERALKKTVEELS